MIRECIAGQTYTARIGVRDNTTPDVAKINPTINANDFFISVNDGAWELLDNTPTVSPAGSEVIKVVFSVAETTAAGAGGAIVLRVADASNSDGWLGGLWEFPVRASALSTLTAAQVNAEADTALADYDAPTKAELDSAVSPLATATALATVDTVVDAILLDTGTDGVVVATASKTGYALSSAGVQAIWEYSTRTLSSFGTLIADMWAYATRTLTSFGSIAGAVATVTGGNIVVYANDTWRFSISNSSLALSGYEAVAFIAKSYSGHVDNDAILYVRSDTGLVRIGGAAGTAGNGSLTVDSTHTLTVNISLSATGVVPGGYTWWIKGISTTPSPTTGYTLATGRFTVYPAGLQAIS